MKNVTILEILIAKRLRKKTLLFKEMCCNEIRWFIENIEKGKNWSKTNKEKRFKVRSSQTAFHATTDMQKQPFADIVQNRFS